MKAKGVTQEDVARATGASQAAVSNWKNGAIPKAPMLMKLAAFFGIDSVDFLRASAPENQPPDKLRETGEEYKAKPPPRPAAVYGGPLKQNPLKYFTIPELLEAGRRITSSPSPTPAQVSFLGEILDEIDLRLPKTPSTEE